MTVSSSVARVQYAGVGTTGPFTVPFRFLDPSHLLVIRTLISTGATTTFALGTDYTVSGTGNPTGSVSLVASLSNLYTLTILRNMPLAQATDYIDNDPLPAETLEQDLDYLTMLVQQLQDQLNRTPSFPSNFGTALAPVLSQAPVDQTVLMWSGTTGTIVNGPTITNIATVAANIAAIVSVSASIANVNTVSGDLTNINIVAGDHSSVAALGPIAANIVTAAGISANITTVAGISANVTTVAGISANVTAVAGDLTNINAVQAALTNINAVQAALTNINSVATNIANVNTVAGISANVTTVAGISANVTTVAGVSGNVTTVATNIANVNTVAAANTNITNVAADLGNINTAAGGLTNINSVAAALTNINSVAGDLTNINSVAGDLTNINTCATNIASINSASANAAAAAASAAAAQAAVVGLANEWNFATSTSMADPGTGNVRFDNATLASVTNLALSALSGDSGNPNLRTYINSWDDSTHNPRGIIKIAKDSTHFAIFGVAGAITDNTTWLQIPVTFIASVGTFAAADATEIGFVPAGNDGSGSGTVTTVSVTSANGFAGSVVNPTSAPAISISTTITGLLKGNGTAISAATAGSDYAAPQTAVAGISAAGTTQGTATVLSGNNSIQEITTCAANAGVQLPVASASSCVTVVNRGANALTVYPATSGIINQQSANVGFTVPVNSAVEFNGLSATKWYTLAFQGGDVSSADGSASLSIGAGKVTNTMLAGSIAASKLTGTDIATVGTLTAGATGAGFTVALTTSTITGNLPIANMPSIAANTFLANGTAGAAAPTAIALTASQLAGRGATGNITAISLGTGLSMSGATLNATAAGMTQGTLTASTSGTEVDFTGVPSTVKRITMGFKGVSTSGTSNLLVQIGPGSYVATGYVGGGTHGATAAGSTAGFLIGVTGATGILNGSMTMTLIDSASNLWAASGVLYDSVNNLISNVAGYVALAGALTQLRLTTVNGTDTFDAGAVNIVYE